MSVTTRPEIDLHPRARTIETLSRDAWDVVILGGGPTGQTIAVRLATAGAGLSVLLVESEIVGGECAIQTQFNADLQNNFACVPSKALLRPLEAMADAQAVGGTREMLSKVSGKIDLEGLWGFRDRATSNWNDAGITAGLTEMGITVVHGLGSIAAPQKVRIADWHTKKDRVVDAKSVVIATGSEPMIPKIQGIAESGYWIPRDAVAARRVPEHLIILGAGPVGSEFATIYSKIGSRVTLVTTNPQILPQCPDEAAKRVHQSLEAMGATVRTNTQTTSVQRTDGKVTLTLNDKTTIEGTELLVATGRTTRTRGMGLTALGITEGQPIAVDAHMHATAVADGWLYAIGDTNGIGNTTHMGMYEATICAQHILSSTSISSTIVPGTDTAPPQLCDTIPQTCFTCPQVSWVGLAPSAAQNRGISDARQIAVETGAPGTHSYLYAEDYSGWAAWTIQASTGKILGACFVGTGGQANLLHASTVAVSAGLTWMQMVHAVPSFPTLSEAYQLLVGACVAEKW